MGNPIQTETTELNYPQPLDLPPQTTATPISQDSPRPPKKPNGLIPMIVGSLITIVALVVAGSFVYENYQLKQKDLSIIQTTQTPEPNNSNTPQPTTNPFADWQTYTNSDMNFSFKYPSNWSVFLADISDNKLITIHLHIINMSVEDFFNPEANSEAISLTVTSFNAEDTETIESITNKEDVIREETIEIGRKSTKVFIKERVVLGITSYSSELYIPLGEKNLLITATTQSKTAFDNFAPLFKQILSTFEFSESLGNFSKRLYNPTQSFFGDSQDYPKELKDLPDTQLEDVKCSDYFYKDEDQQYSYTSQQPDHSYKKTYLENQLVKTFSSQRNPDELLFCETSKGVLYVMSGVLGQGGGAGSTSYFTKIQSNGSVLNEVEIPMEAEPYFNCGKPLALTTTDVFYWRCGGGDGGYGSSSIYSIDFKTQKSTRLAKCTSMATGDPEKPVTITCN